ncbi:hypothetical protein ACJ73_04984 [Blastomyces percursus]|uniref:Uncharacterized protein n=1 Tax=Blastomyces percursus TaxID=1658174 RepID=A0A1J9R6Q6_9EURO|nr:hypothetical protein ACJ73_04984 [Blastomyces percursus]
MQFGADIVHFMNANFCIQSEFIQPTLKLCVTSTLPGAEPASQGDFETDMALASQKHEDALHMRMCNS